MKPMKKWVKRVVIIINVTALATSIAVMLICLLSSKYEKDWLGITLSISQIVFFGCALLYFCTYPSEKIFDPSIWVIISDEDYDWSEDENCGNDDDPDPAA